MAAFIPILAENPKARLVLDQMHPIGDHWPFTEHCRGWAGGGRRHMKLALRYRWLPLLRALTLCKLGRHHYIWHRVPAQKIRILICEYCDRQLTAGRRAK